MSIVTSTNPTRRRVPSVSRIAKVKEIQPNDNLDSPNYAYEVTRSFRNHLSYPVVLTDRNNLSVKIPSQRRPINGDPELSIDILIKYSADVVFDYTHVLDYVDENSPMELQVIKKVLNNQRVNVQYGKNYILFSYRVDDLMIKRHHNSVYLEQVDMVVSREDVCRDVVHPYSSLGQALIINHNPFVFSYSILINDPEKQFGDRFININGDVYQVRSTVDYSVSPGVYVYTDITTRYDFHEADEKLKLYTTAAIARQLGVPEEHVKAQIDQQTLQYKRELLDKEKEIAEIKHAQSLEDLVRKQEHEKAMQDIKDREAELKRLELEYKRLSSVESQRLNELKHDLEMRSANRKDASEFMKWLPALVGGAAALIAAFI